MISLVSAGEAQKGDYKYFVRWDNDKTGGRFFESKIVGTENRDPVLVLAHDGDRGLYKKHEVFKITECPAKKGDHVIAYWEYRSYAFAGKQNTALKNSRNQPTPIISFLDMGLCRLTQIFHQI